MRRAADGSHRRSRGARRFVGVAVGFAVLAGLIGPAAALPGPDCAYQIRLAALPASGAVPLLVNFSASASSGTPTFFAWSFGDGGYWNDTSGPTSTPLHRYSAEGDYVASVTVGEPGCDAMANTTVSVTAGPLVVGIVATPTSGDAPLTVAFAATVSGGTGTYASATWSFGDGGVGSGLRLSYTYAQPGTFSAVLTVTDTSGHSSVAHAEITVGTPTGGGGGSLPLPLWAYPIVGALAGTAVFAIQWRSRGPRRPPGLGQPSDEAPDPPAPAEDRPVPAPSSAMSGPNDQGAPATEVSPLDLGRGVPGPEPASTPAPPPVDQLRLSERVVLHVGDQGTLSSYDVAPNEFTQAGMVQALGATQNSLTNVLRRLTAAGALSQELRHVQGRSRRLRVYVLTPRGERLYRELRSRRGLPRRKP